MKFTFDSDLKLIISPIVLRIANKEYYFENGSALSDIQFDCKYEITSVKAIDNKIEITAVEKSLLPTEDWTDKELSFF